MTNPQSSARRAPSTTFKIEGALTISRATELQQSLLTAVQDSKKSTITLDVSGVTDVDAAGLQLLIATQKLADRNGREMTLRAPSAPLHEALKLMKLDGLFTLSTGKRKGASA